MLSIKDYEDALARARQTGNQRMEASMLGSLTNMYARQGDLATGLRYGLQAIEAYKRLGDHRSVALTAKNIAGIYEIGMRDVQSAIPWLEMAVAYEPENETYTAMLAAALQRVAGSEW